MNLENYTNINIFKKVFENREVMSSNNMIEQPHHKNKEAGAVEHASGFNPYVNNQGTTVGKNAFSSHKNLTNYLFQLSPERTSALLQLTPVFPQDTAS